MDCQITIIDFPLICCFCLVKSSELKLITDIPSVKLFAIITEITIKEALPQNICLVCEKLFNNFYEFIEKSKHNISLLKTILSKQGEDECVHYNNTLSTGTISEPKETIIKRKYNNSKETNLSSIKTKIHRNNIEKLNRKTAKPKVKYQKRKNDVSSEKEHHIKVHDDYLSETQKLNHGKDNLEDIHLNSSFNSPSSKIKENTCNNCNVNFTTKTKYYKHLKNSVECSTVGFNCSECNKAFNKKHKLVTHMRSHTKEEPFECDECGKGFRFQQNLRRHILIHKGVKPFTCEVCGKAFSRAHVKNEHMNIHTGNNPYICMYCGKGFKRYANHFIHVYRHKLINGEIDKTEDRKLYLQLECNICNKIFASRGGLANHMALHQETPREKKFLCNECGKGFVTKTQLKSHSRTHTGECPYECNHCGKRFKQKSAYSNHQLIHSGEKPYRCKICEKLFTQSGHLKVHMRVHTGEKPFVCNFCGKSFALKSNLKVNLKIHPKGQASLNTLKYYVKNKFH